MPYITLPGAKNGLLVNDLDTCDGQHNGMWKVSHVFEETPAVISDLAFARRKDAEMAMLAIESEADWTQSASNVIADLRANGWTSRALRQRMLEAMQW